MERHGSPSRVSIVAPSRLIPCSPPRCMPAADQRVRALAVCFKVLRRATLAAFLSSPTCFFSVPSPHFFAVFPFSQSFPTYPDSQRQLQEIKDWLSSRHYDALGIGTFGPVDPREVGVGGVYSLWVGCTACICLQKLNFTSCCPCLLYGVFGRG